MSSKKDQEEDKPKSGFSRRGFIRTAGATTGAIGLLEKGEDEAQAATAKGVSGPGTIPITLNINGREYKAQVEPRYTLLDTMRNSLDLTAAKRVCDRGTCGACTVIVNGKAIYSCTTLAIDSQGRQIQTLEGLSAGSRPHPLVQAFVDNDAQQCGYCTPGMVMASKAFLDRNPAPTIEQVKEGMGGNLCRCGTYMGIRKAVVQAGQVMKGAKNA